MRVVKVVVVSKVLKLSLDKVPNEIDIKYL